MGEPLMEALLDFKVFFTNRQYDVQFGRSDIESMDWFPGGISNENMNKWAAELLDGPPLLPVAAERASAGIVPEPSNDASATLQPLGELKVIKETSAEYEPMGFEYFRRSTQGGSNPQTQATEEALAEEAGASTDGCLDCCAPSDFYEAGTSAPACVSMSEPPFQLSPKSPRGRMACRSASPGGSGSRRQGSAHWNGSRKTLSPSPLRARPIQPTTPLELELLAKALELVAKVPADSSTKRKRKRKLGENDGYFQAVAEKFSELGAATLARSSPPSQADLRGIVTSGDLIKATIDSMAGHQQDVDHTRERLREEEALNQATGEPAVVTEGGSWGIMQLMTGLTGLISNAPVVPAAPATPAAPAAPDDAGDVAAIITALAAPESSGASAAPLQGPAMCSESGEEPITVVKSELDPPKKKITWHVVQGLARHFKVKYMNNSTVTEGDERKAKVVRKPRGAIIAEVLQLWPADLDAITVMPPVKKLK